MSDPDLHLFQKGYEREYHFPYSISTWENEFKALLDLVPVRANSRSCHSFVSSARGNVRHYTKNDMGDYRVLFILAFLFFFCVSNLFSFLV